MKNYNINCRMATEKDDICAIARYIHLTDPYIYPVICSSPCNKDWQDIIQGCYFSMDNVFSMKNIIVAEIDNEIIGILCVIPCQRSLHFIKDVPKQSALYSGILKANEGYFEPLIKESMELDGYKLHPVGVTVVEKSESGTLLRMTLSEGRNRQIRRMCEAVGLEVKRLCRVSIGPIKLDGLPVGKWRYLSQKEVDLLFKASALK